ncbi:unnamed protein product [Thelazia callipaeda]|uniref:AcidPPc domain-containing protein n=1 Tax=Thelazia callipaeda TaxID=103827 RepID=A0A0N5CKM2_THECL|nr:unnamed protein product [Thelazia callipaeda]
MKLNDSVDGLHIFLNELQRWLMVSIYDYRRRLSRLQDPLFNYFETQLLIWDREITSLMTLRAALDSRSDLRYLFLWLEWMVHGLIIDLVAVGVIKGIVRRPRPPCNVHDLYFGAPVVDVFSFPSGHSSRSAMLSVLCMDLCPPPHYISFFVKLFPFVLGASRIVIGRHYFSDVAAGLLLGYFEGNLVQCLPFSSVNLLKEIFLPIFGND